MEDKGLRRDVHKLISDAIKYFELKWEYFKLDIVETLALLYTRIFSLLLWWIIIPVFLLFVFIGLALYLGTLWGKLYLGFFAVAGGILVLALLFILLRRPLLTNPLINVFITAMFEQQQMEQNKKQSNEQTTSTNKESK